MNKIYIAFIVLFHFCFFHLTYSQDYSYKPSGEVLVEAYKALGNEDTTTALNLLQTVSKYDTNYYTAIADRIYLNNRLGNNEVSLTLLEEAMQKPGDSEMRLFVLKTIALSNLKEYDLAIATAREGLAKFPYSNSLYINIAECFIEKEQLDSAIYNYQKAIYHNYSASSGHIGLGVVYAENGYLTEAAFAITMGIISDNSTSSLGARIGYLENIVRNEHDQPKKPVQLPDALELDEIDLLLENKIALSKKYKVKSDFAQYDLVKSFNLILEKLPEDIDKNSFFYKNYISFFKGVYDQKLLDGQYAYMLAGLADQDKSIAAKVKSNDKVLKNFISYAQKKFEEIGSRADVIDGVKPKETEYYFQSGDLISIGHYTDKYVGEWEFYHPNGVVKSKGRFDNTGEKSGTWYWFDEKGDSTYSVTFDNGKRIGAQRSYHVNGVVSVALKNNAEEEIDGEVVDYFLNGALYSTTQYSKSQRDGVQTYYNLIGSKKSEVPWKAGEVQGIYKGFYSDGSLKFEEPFQDSERHGEATYYHQGTKVVSAEGAYEEGLKTGKWTWYYPNGKVEQTGSYLKGSPIGHWEDFDIDGNLTKSYDYDENTKRNGTSKSYYKGTLIREEVYSKGEYIGYTCYDLNGTILSQAKRKKKILPVQIYYPEGYLQSKGNLENGENEGRWVFYFENGAIKSTEEYSGGLIVNTDSSFYEFGGLQNTTEYNKNGESHGPSKSYYSNGKVSELIWYEDDLMTGWNIEFNVLGDTTHTGYFLDGKVQGRTTDFYLNGNTKSQFEYDNSFITHFYAYDTNGVLIYDADLTLGSQKIEMPYDNGNIYKIAHYQNGRSHGLFQWNYYNGTTETVGEIFDGDRHGVWKWFNQFNQLVTEGEYHYGVKIGEWKYYDNLGRLEKVNNYNANGNLDGDLMNYYPNGEVAISRQYIDGNLDGESHYYDDTGELQFVEYCRNGVIISYAYNDLNGKLKEPTLIKNETAHIKTYFSNGKVSAEKTYKNGTLDVLYEKYKSNGKLDFRCQFENGMYQGLYESFYPNGTPFEAVNYLDDTKHGKATYYYENGKVQSEGNYVADQEHGEFKYYDESGNLVKTVLYNTGLIIKAW
jgi:antitoxin component YwqK of YwqJK toxin-antitoxin module